jgi:hypothetical protein
MPPPLFPSTPDGARFLEVGTPDGGNESLALYTPSTFALPTTVVHHTGLE